MTTPAANGIRIHRNPRVAPPRRAVRKRARADPERGGLSSPPRRRSAAGPATPTRRCIVCRAWRRGSAWRRSTTRTSAAASASSSFKALGGAYAVFRLLAKAVEARNGGQAVDSRPTDRGLLARHRASRHRHLRDRRQSRTLRRLGSAALRLPLRHLRPRVRERGAVRRDRAIRRRRDPRAGQLRRLGAPRRGRGAAGTAGPSCRTRPTRVTARFRST